MHHRIDCVSLNNFNCHKNDIAVLSSSRINLGPLYIKKYTAQPILFIFKVTMVALAQPCTMIQLSSFLILQRLLQRQLFPNKEVV